MTSSKLFSFARSATVALIAGVIATTLWAEDCREGGITITTQEQIDNFQQLYSNGGICDTVVGGLAIHGDDIVNLDGLSDLRSLFTLSISDNPLLTDIDGLSGVTSISFGEFRNSRWSVTVDRNAVLTNLDGLSGLSALEGSLEIQDNPKLVNMDGLLGITEVYHSITITNNDSLTSLAGLANVSQTQYLRIEQNDTLENLDGLNSLKGTFKRVEVNSNGALNNLDALSQIEFVSVMWVASNSSLSDCQGVVKLIDPIDDYDLNPDPQNPAWPDADIITIQDNLPGCNSVNDVLGSVPITHLDSGLNDAWFNPDTDGQGFFLTFYPELQKAFVSWYTYDIERPMEGATATLGEPGHRWLTAQGSYEANVADLEIYLTSGGLFDSPQPIPSTEPYGEMTLEFSTCNAGTVVYTIPSAGVQGVIPIQRIALDNVPLCYVLNQEATATR